MDPLYRWIVPDTAVWNFWDDFAVTRDHIRVGGEGIVLMLERLRTMIDSL